MNRKVVIESLARTPDGQGGYSEAWSPFATVFAKIETKNLFEQFFADKIRPGSKTVITIRWLDGIDETMRITETIGTYATKYYQIKGIDFADEKRFQMVLYCEENTET